MMNMMIISVLKRVIIIIIRVMIITVLKRVSAEA